MRPVSLSHSGATGPRPITQSELATALALASTPDSSAVTPTTSSQVTRVSQPIDRRRASHPGPSVIVLRLLLFYHCYCLTFVIVLWLLLFYVYYCFMLFYVYYCFMFVIVLCLLLFYVILCLLLFYVCYCFTFVIVLCLLWSVKGLQMHISCVAPV